MSENLEEESERKEHRHVGYFDVTFNLLKEMLKLPVEANVLSVTANHDHPFTFRVYVEHPGCPEWNEEWKQAPERVTPRHMTEQQIIEFDSGHVAVNTVEFDGW